MISNIEFIRVPEGEFVMGASSGDKLARENEFPPHRVYVNSFHLSKYLVTQKQFERIMGFNPSYFSNDLQGIGLKDELDTADFPVETVSWNDAVSFCKKLSESSKYTYRLPTEEEWEFACRGGSQSVFNRGDSYTSHNANILGLYPYNSQEIGPSLNRTTRVGQYPPNQYGLYDMHGNVWEWCLNDYYLYGQNGINLTPAKVLRGGAWNCYSRFCRCSYRCISEENVRYYDCGFRIVKEER